MNKNYIDVTKKWLINATPNSHNVEDQGFYEYDGILYKVDGKNVVLDYSAKEKEIAEWLKNTFGGEIKMIPRINYPKSISTPDYLFKSIKFDLKEINGQSKRTIENALKNKKRQASNFILDLSNSHLTMNDVFLQMDLLYSYRKRKWINIVILKKENNLIGVYQRKRS